MAAPLRLAGPGSGSEGHRALVCIGFMGAGKTTAARSAAEALGTNAIDVDAVIEQRLGKPIDEVFAEDGEAAFRAREERVTLELLSASSTDVVALGGGAVGSRERPRGAGRSPGRVARHRPRRPPGSAAAAAAGRWRATASSSSASTQQREPLYAALADVIVPGRALARDGAGARRARRAPARHEAAVGDGGRPRLPGLHRPGLLTSTGSGRRRSPAAASW